MYLYIYLFVAIMRGNFECMTLSIEIVVSHSFVMEDPFLEIGVEFSLGTDNHFFLSVNIIILFWV